jgi:hypothetical protein
MAFSTKYKKSDIGNQRLLTVISVDVIKLSKYKNNEIKVSNNCLRGLFPDYPEISGWREKA